jgi:toxin FitB
MRYLLDTNVISELRKVGSGRANPAVTLWASTVDSNDLYLSVITMQELEIGVLSAERADPLKGKALRQWLHGSITDLFKNRILVLDTTAAFISAKFNVPNPTPFRDGFIAAIAATHGMTLVTRNTKDFERTGVTLLNPWLFS